MFHQSDLVALPSCTEGFGLVALEAISAGIPVLVAGKSGIAKALQNVKGRKIVIVKSNDPAKWAQRIKRLSNQSPEKRQTNALQLRENYRQVYSWQTECEKFIRIIQNAMKCPNGMSTEPSICCSLRLLFTVCICFTGYHRKLYKNKTFKLTVFT